MGNPWEIVRNDIRYPIKFYGKVIDGADGRKECVGGEDITVVAYDVPIPGKMRLRKRLKRTKYTDKLNFFYWTCISNACISDWTDVGTYTEYTMITGDITDMAWSPSPIPMDDKRILVLATTSVDKKVKLWAAPSLNAS
ncbi:hypothetical protein T459_20309 [Capsicum annuum]|uniref:Uncharacterized protein n=1 Tax=Capsicum annuum TaxID=4072 RepID=A0A2G2Z440_CAPAN|nr:hypothetical protein T459_20309 [Capsicum annuum]